MRFRILDIEVTEHPAGIVLLACRGELDLASAPELVDHARAAVRGGARRVCVDLTGIDHLDSAGIAALVNVRRYVIRALGSLVIVCPAGRIQRLLTVTGLEPYFDIEPSREEALHHLVAG